MIISRKALTTLCATAVVALTACTAEKAVDNTVDASLFATRTVVKGAVGAGKLVAKGTNAAVRGASDED
ncbi:hypothetical protein [Roseivivax sp. CAU 1761]